MKNVFLWILLVTVTLLAADGSSWAAPVAATKTSDIITKGPWVDVRAFNNLSTAVASPQSAGKTILVPNVQNMNNLTIPSDRAVKIIKGGSIYVATGKTLTINGPFDAGLYQVFGTGGSIAFGSNTIAVYPEWWGAHGDGVTDDTGFIETALNTGKKVRLSDKTYACNITIVRNGSHLEGKLGYFNTTGDPISGTILKPYIGTNPVIDINAGDPTDGIIIRGISFVGNGTGIGLRLEYVRHSVFENLNFHDFTTCIHAEKTNWMNNYTNIQMYWFSVAGFYLNNGSEDSQFINCLARGYQTASIGLKINYYCQLNNFTSCDFSDNKINVYLELSSDIGGNRPIITFDSCIFEQGSTEGAGFANSAGFVINAPYGSSRYVSCIVNMNGCRFLYKDSATLSSAKAFNLYGDGDIYINLNGTNLANYPVAFTRVTGPGFTRIKGSVIFLGTTLFSGFTQGALHSEVSINSPTLTERVKTLLSTSGEIVGNWNFTSGSFSINLDNIGINGVVKIYLRRVDSSTSTLFGELLVQEKGSNANAAITELTDVAAVYNYSAVGNTVWISCTASPAPVVMYKIVKLL